MTRLTVMIATALAAISLTGKAAAQELVLGGHLGLASGLEAGDPGDGETKFRRARTRIVAELDGRNSEDMAQGLGIVAFTEVQPHFSIGSELRYMRWLSPSVIGFAGATGTLAPHTLFGGVFGLQFHVPFDSAGSTVFFEPSFSAMPLGTDLPADRVLVWGLLTVGVHAKL